MTLHIPYDHQCPRCEAWYIPYDQAVPCPRCGLVEKQRFDFIRQAVASASFNLADQGSYQPKAWATNCYADHILWLLFMVLEHHRNSPQRPFAEAAREAVNQMEWGEQPYGKDHLYGIALKVHEDLEGLRIRREKSLLHRVFRRFFY